MTRQAVANPAVGCALAGPIGASDLMLASTASAPFDRDDWLYELKLDCYRCLTQVDGGHVALTSRQGNPLAPSFPEIVDALGSVRRNVVMDAELTVDDERGHQLFHALQRRARTSVPKRASQAARTNPARLYVFDLLAIDRRDIRGLPLLERKRLLRDIFADSQTLVFVNGILGHGRAAFEQIHSLGLEGLVAKRLNATYRRGRTRDWLKILNPSYHRREEVLAGWKKRQASGTGE